MDQNNLLIDYAFVERITLKWWNRSKKLLIHKGYDACDLVNEMWVKTLHLIENNKNRQDIRNFKAFVNRSIKYQILDLIKNAKINSKHIVTKVEYPIELGIEETDDYSNENLSAYEYWKDYNEIERNDIISAAKTVLSEAEYELLLSYSQGYTYQELCDIFSQKYGNISVKFIYKMLKRISWKIEGMLRRDTLITKGVDLHDRKTRVL